MKKTDAYRRPLRAMTAVLAATVAITLSGCQSDLEQSGQSGAEQSGEAVVASNTDAFFSRASLNTVNVEFDQDEYQSMLDTFADSGSKEWIKATVTINGNTFTDVGLRLKGNSSLRGLRNTAEGAQSGDEQVMDEGDGQVDPENPQTMPWLIRLDKYVEGQSYAGRTDFAVRGSNTQTSLGEALAVSLLQEAGVPTQLAAYARFSINGSAKQLRLIVDVPDDSLWNQDNFDGTGITYKAESDGDYSYRGDDPSQYAEVFEQKYGDADMAPLIEFLDFINNSTDAEFASGLANHLDVDGFATYLAMQELIGNTDDIDGPGNNSYLHYDPESGLMTVVSWDHNLAFGAMMGVGGIGGRGGFPGGFPGDAPAGAEGAMPEGMSDWPMSGDRPEGATGEMPADGFEPGQRPEGMPEGMPEGLPDNFQEGDTTQGMAGKTNILATRFRANQEFSQLIDQKTQELTADLFDSGFAGEVLNLYAQLLVDQASDLVDRDTVRQEVEDIESFLNGDTADMGQPGFGEGAEGPQSEGAQSS